MSLLISHQFKVLLALQTSDNKVPDSNPTGDRIELMFVWRFIAQSLPLSHVHDLNMERYLKRDIKH